MPTESFMLIDVPLWPLITLWMDLCPSKQETRFSSLVQEAFLCKVLSNICTFRLLTAFLIYHSFALQFAVAAGATVIATSSSDEKLKIASKLGAKHVINYSKTPNWDEEVLKIVCLAFFIIISCQDPLTILKFQTNGNGVNFVIEVRFLSRFSGSSVEHCSS